MKPKTLKIAYWVATVLVALWLLADGIAGVMRAQAGMDSLVHLGYPVYLLTISGIAKILGAIAILQTRFRTIKEWAYAGYAFNCLLAFASHLYVGDAVFLTVMPLIFLAIAMIPYFLWRKIR